MNETVINCEDFETGFRSGLIFSMFEGLKAGESFRLISTTRLESMKDQFTSAKLANLKYETHQDGNGMWEMRIEKIPVDFVGNT